LPVCPTDAIVGSNKRMHSVIELHCTGCELCLPVCPVDCISLMDVSGVQTGWSAWSAPQADSARQRYALHQIRQQKEVQAQDERLEQKAQAKLADLPAHSLHTDPAVLNNKRAVIEAALTRARAKRKDGD
jgi:electron transport complex protein RnfB